MNKKVFSLCLGAVLLLLASCSGGYSSKEIDGVEFTEMGAEEPMKLNRTSIYTYPAIDAQGNWTKRQVESEGAMITEVRSISYF